MTPDERQRKLAELAELEQMESPPEISQQAAPLTENELLRQGGQSAYDSMSNYGKFGVGVAKGAINTWYGLRDLFGDDLSKEEQETLERLAGTEGGWATAGEVTGDLAAFALPAAKVGQLVTKLSKFAPKLLAKAAPFLADLGFSVGVEGVKAPTSDTSRSDRMASAAAGYLATAGGMKFLGGLKNGIQNGFVTVTEAAQALLDKGIKLTPMQAGEGKQGMINAIETFMEFTPFAGSKVTEMKTRNLADWNKTLFNDPKVNPLSNTPIENAGGKGFKELQNNFSKAYDDVWNSPELIPDNMDFGRLSTTFNDAINNADSLVGVNSAPQFKKLLKDASSSLNKFYKTGNTKFLSDADDMLRDAKIDDFASTGQISNIRDEIKDAMPNGLGNRLREVDKNYAHYSVLSRGGSYVDALKNNQELSPVNLMSAVKAKGKERQLTTAEALMQKEAQKGIDVFGNYRPKNSVLRKSLGAMAAYGEPVSALTTMAVTSPLANDAMSSFMIKGMPETKQQALANVLRMMGEKTGATNVLNKGKEIAPSFNQQELNDLLKRGGAFYGGADEY